MSNTWAPLGQNIVGENDGDRSGTSVSLNGDGTIIAIGAPRNDGTAVNAGHVRIYQYIGSSWIPLGSDINGEALGDQFGYSVSLSASGNRVAIGAPRNKGEGMDNSLRGTVRIYEYDSGSWNLISMDSIIDNNTTDGEQSGWSVSLSGDGNVVAIGSPLFSIGLLGRVRTFIDDSGSWVEYGQIGGIIGTTSSRLGYSVSLNYDGTIMAIGEPNSALGKVRIYKYYTQWEVYGGGFIVVTDLGTDFGWSVSLNSAGDRVAIGEPRDTNDNKGRVHIYSIQETFIFSNGTILPTNPPLPIDQTNGFFGWSVSLNGNGQRIAIGAPGQGNVNSTNYAQIHEAIANTWTKIGQNIEGGAIANRYRFGTSVSLSNIGSRVAIGGPFIDENNTPDETNAGNAQVFEYIDLLNSNICFPASTPVNTDQGVIAIDKIIPGVHTIGKHRIVDITNTTLLSDRHLVCFEKNALGNGVPSDKTIMTRGHQILYNDKWCKAGNMVNNDSIYQVRYRGEILYNVLLETHERMYVNNMICETLYPRSDIAKMYAALKHMTPEQRNEYIEDTNRRLAPTPVI